MSWLWPIVTGLTFFDVWTLAHLGFWVFVGSTLWALELNKRFSFVSCMLVAFGWEVFEKIAEYAWTSVWRDPESWYNSWLSDPLMCVVGFLGIWWMLDHRRKR